MPVKGTKALEAVKKSTVISTYTTALPVAPAVGHIAVYVDLAAADQHQKMETINALKELIDRAREENYRRPSGSTTCYYYVGAGPGRKSQITFTTTSTEIQEKMVAIGIEASVRSGSKGSLLLDTCWKEIIDWMSEQGRLTA